MAITRTPMVDDDGSGTTGTIINSAWKVELYDQIDAAIVTGLAPAWENVPFNAANFSGQAPMTWTVGAAAITRNKCVRNGKTLIWSFYISWFAGSNVLGGTPSNTLILVPPFPLIADQYQVVTYSVFGGTHRTAEAVASVSAPTTIYVRKSDSSNFAAADTPGLISTFVLEMA